MDQFEGCVGADGAKSGWLAVWWQPAALGYRLYPDALSLVEAHRAARVIAVDIPIGLPERGGRRADIEARKFVGGRREKGSGSFSRREVRTIYPGEAAFW